MVPKVGIEPTRGHPRWILSPVRLPISPLRLKRFGSIAERTFEVKGEIEVINAEKNVDTEMPLCYKQVSLDGAVAQLGERLNGIQEVRGSIPRSSTIKKSRHLANPPRCLFLFLLPFPTLVSRHFQIA
jgi:hypothetical protein